MKVALLVYRFTDVRGGGERACVNLARGLLGAGHEIHTYAGRYDEGALPDGAVAHTVPVINFNAAWKHRSFAARSKKILEAESYDIIHSFTRTYHQDILRLGGGIHAEYLACRDAQRPLLNRWWARISPKERVQLKLDRLAFRGRTYRRIVAVSHRVKGDVIRHHGVPESDVMVIHNGVDIRRYSPELRRTHRASTRKELGIPETDLVFLFCGMNGRLKGLPSAIDALAKVSARLLVVGEPHTSRFRARASRLGIADRVHFLGHRTDAERFYGASDALVHPSFFDPFPNVCLEAMATGLPVITTSVTGVAEVITDGKDSFIVKDGYDVDAIAERMKELEDDKRREEISRAARATAETRSLKKNLEENLRLYGEVLKEKEGNPVTR